LGAAMGAGKMSFGSAERLMEHLGVRPGAVSPLAMVTGSGNGVRLYMDRAVQQAEIVHAHPLVNDRTVGLAPEDLLVLLARWGAGVTWLDLPGLDIPGLDLPG
ncbi:MAG: YbaK/EbsC family protein, partial [Pseudomonadota bacterium]